MTSLGYEFSSDDSQVRALLQRVDRAIGDASLLAWLAGDAEEHIKNRARERFSGEGDDVSGQWAPLSPYTIAERTREQTWPGKIQHRTGALESYITNGHASIGVDPEGLTLNAPETAGDPILAAKFNSAQAGNSRTGAPARPVLGMNQTDSSVLLALLTAHITEIISFGGR